jgi:hypothetical protein
MDDLKKKWYLSSFDSGGLEELASYGARQHAFGPFRLLNVSSKVLSYVETADPRNLT